MTAASAPPAQRRYGLALSGGGFRAALYHLGVIRSLRDAGLLNGVSHIASVSGGSILGAHLVLNWDRYTGTDEAFEAAAAEVLGFVQLDVRNRILRRFPLYSALNVLRRLVLLSPLRRFTRTGLLERYYQTELYGDRGLIQLPASPHLYILATNLSEGSLCAFSRDGLLMQHRNHAQARIEVRNVHLGLATVSMAVTASSAFPGFFPPLELSPDDLGPGEAEFSRHAFTDGGVYDNLGLRFFHFLRGKTGTTRVEGEESRHAQLDQIFVSDAGTHLKVTNPGGSAGLLQTALRASDILMDRVNQLEHETFLDSEDVVFMPITRIVSPEQDPGAPHPEIQRQAARIRTDMDRFSDLEIAALVRQGYAVARQSLRESRGGQPSLGGSDDGPAAWTPTFVAQRSLPPLESAASALPVARRLQRATNRRLLSTFFDFRDWPTYVWLPLVLLVVLGMPLEIYRAREITRQQRMVQYAMEQSSQLYGDVMRHLSHRSPEPIPELAATEVDTVDALDFTGYKVLSDERVYDLRGWTSSDQPKFAPRMHARFRLVRTETGSEHAVLRIHLPTEQEPLHARYQPAGLRPQHVRARTAEGWVYETSLDFSAVPVGAETNLVVEEDLPAVVARQDDDAGSLIFNVVAQTGVVRVWLLLPKGRPHDQFELHRRRLDRPDEVEIIHATTSVEVPNGAIAAFHMINPAEGYRYECHWSWLDHTGGED